MVKDLFSKVLRVPETIDVAKLDGDILNAVRDGTGKYSGNLIIKPSAFRTTGDGLTPLYAKVTRA